MTTYDAAFSAPAVQGAWEGGDNRPPASLYCISGTTYARYDWTGTNRPWSGGTPDRQGNITGSQTDHGLFGYWYLPSWWGGRIDAAYCQAPIHMRTAEWLSCRARASGGGHTYTRTRREVGGTNR